MTLVGAAYCVMAQRTERVTAEYTYYAPESMSINEAKHMALERAKQEAIATQWGTIVSQANTSVVINDNGNSDTRFFSVGESRLKGEWIETIGEPKYDISFTEGILIVKVSVSGRIREVENELPEIDVKTYRNFIGRNHESVDFFDGDDFYMTVSTGVDGYLLAYLLDETSRVAYRLLPYQKSKEGNVRLNTGTEHQFFKSEVDGKSGEMIDSYTMTSDADVEFSRLYVIFSEHPIRRLTSENVSSDELPREVDESRFHNWLLKTRMSKGITVRELLLKVSRKR